MLGFARLLQVAAYVEASVSIVGLMQGRDISENLQSASAFSLPRVLLTASVTRFHRNYFVVKSLS